MEKNNTIYTNRLPLLTWLVTPLLGVWLATNYIVGLNNKVNWKPAENNTPQVLGVETKNTEEQQFVWNGEGLLTFWFDGSWYSQYSNGYSILTKNGYKAAISVATNEVGGEKYMTWPQIQKLSNKGWDVSSLGVNHICDERNFTPEVIDFEINESIKIFKDNGINVEDFVTPCGIENKALLNSVKERYLAMRTAQGGMNELPVQNPYSLKVHAVINNTTIADVKKWITDANKNKSWLILVFHQIGDGSNPYEISPEFFNRIVSEVQKSEISVVIPSEALNVAIPNTK